MIHIFILHLLVVASSFCGSLYYGVTSKEPSWIRKAALLMISFITGLVAAEFVANLLSGMVPGEAEAEQPLGALAASAFAVRWLFLLRRFIERKTGNLIPTRFTGDYIFE